MCKFMSKEIIKVENLCKHYIIKKGIIPQKTVIKAVDNVSFSVERGETLALIGESGSGKTTVSYLILKLLKGDSGRIFYEERDITYLPQRDMRALRKEMQIIFQQSQGTLDPKMTIEELLLEPLTNYKIVEGKLLEGEVKRLLSLVGLSDNERHKFPHQLSGGQRQRISIARAIATRPRFIICDEPVSALDVSVQGQILNLLSDLKKELDLTYLFISHDLKVIKHICNRAAVMYKGKLVEIGDIEQVLKEPNHDYTRQLVEAVL